MCMYSAVRACVSAPWERERERVCRGQSCGMRRLVPERPDARTGERDCERGEPSAPAGRPGQHERVRARARTFARGYGASPVLRLRKGPAQSKRQEAQHISEHFGFSLSFVRLFLHHTKNGIVFVGEE